MLTKKTVISNIPQFRTQELKKEKKKRQNQFKIASIVIKIRY